MRFITFCLLFNIIGYCSAHAQTDSLSTKANGNVIVAKPDSILSDAMIKTNRQQFMADSVAMRFLIPDPLRENQFINNLLKINLADFYSLRNLRTNTIYRTSNGLLRKTRDPWVIVTIVCLLIYTALINVFFSVDVSSVIQSFYKKSMLAHLDKEGGLINLWAFIGLFLLFSLTSGFVLYQVTTYYNIYYSFSGFRLFVMLSATIGFLFLFKFIMLKFISFVFDITRPVSQYITLLNLTYFNITFVLLSVAICFCLLSGPYIPLLLMITIIIVAIIFAWQFIRNSINIISNFQFHKFYLFIYLCALEICPVLILIKSLKI